MTYLIVGFLVLWVVLIAAAVWLGRELLRLERKVADHAGQYENIECKLYKEDDGDE